MRVAIQGELGSFHAAAAEQWFSSSLEIIPAASFRETFAHVAEGRADALVVAIENSLYGGINQVYDLIEAYGYPIVGEIHLPVRHALISSGSLETITHIYSHPVALAQCEDTLHALLPRATKVEYHDTAAAVPFVKNNPALAAVASESAAALYDVPVVRGRIEDNPANFTRFLVLNPNGAVPADASRTSLVVTTDHTPGALAKVLGVFASAQINVAKLQSRPIVGSPWNYRFYIVVDSAGPILERAVATLAPLVDSVKILGQYAHAPHQEDF